MDYVYAVVYEDDREVDVVYTNPEVAEAVCKQANNQYWEEWNTPVRYRKEAYNKYTVNKIPVNTGVPL